MNAMNINTSVYVLSATNASSAVTFTPTDTNCSSLVIYNDGAVPVFLVSGKTSAPTAVFPTSATVPVGGKVIPAGAMVTFSKDPSHRYVAGITASGTASVYISPGAGE